MVEEEGMAIL